MEEKVCLEGLTHVGSFSGVLREAEIAVRVQGESIVSNNVLFWQGNGKISGLNDTTYKFSFRTPYLNKCGCLKCIPDLEASLLPVDREMHISEELDVFFPKFTENGYSKLIDMQLSYMVARFKSFNVKDSVITPRIVNIS